MHRIKSYGQNKIECELLAISFVFWPVLWPKTTLPVAALPVLCQQKNFTWWFLYPKGMGLALLLINSKNFGILDPPNGYVVTAVLLSLCLFLGRSATSIRRF